MKIKNRKKNDRAAFYNLPLEEYRAMPKRKRREWRKPDPKPISLADLIGHPSTNKPL